MTETLPCILSFYFWSPTKCGDERTSLTILGSIILLYWWFYLFLYYDEMWGWANIKRQILDDSLYLFSLHPVKVLLLLRDVKKAPIACNPSWEANRSISDAINSPPPVHVPPSYHRILLYHQNFLVYNESSSSLSFTHRKEQRSNTAWTVTNISMTSRRQYLNTTNSLSRFYILKEMEKRRGRKESSRIDLEEEV